ILSITSAFDVAKPLTAITNAKPAVATSAANGFTDGDIGLVTSGWTELNDRPVRIADATTDSFELEGFDTTSLTRFPVGAGIGSIRKASDFVAFSQVTDVQTSGGEQQYFQWVYMED